MSISRRLRMSAVNVVAMVKSVSSSSVCQKPEFGVGCYWSRNPAASRGITWGIASQEMVWPNLEDSRSLYSKDIQWVAVRCGIPWGSARHEHICTAFDDRMEPDAHDISRDIGSDIQRTKLPHTRRWGWSLIVLSYATSDIFLASCSVQTKAIEKDYRRTKSILLQQINFRHGPLINRLYGE